ncbi:MAG: Mu transposase C-terminal domain-containing protein [Prevotella sp.]|nr:Mu transposase C-terminal domain-containing protein [Alistipes senegalensis]MCM1358224.1 Mu transposase C-terminal domain-containing protein [Prevotella sp.]MCM1474500.1 Mu transposase C-terminal domain-containing protein [Muribaculaceae bacterium]
MEYLTIKQTAELKKCSVRYIRQLCSDGKIKTEIQPHPQNKKPCYMIPVTELPEDLQAKYYGITKKQSPIPEKIKPEIKNRPLTIEELSEKERTELYFWCGLLKEWQSRRSQYEKKCAFDRDFIGECRLKYPDIKISTDILYRKLSAYKNNDYYGIIGRHTSWNAGKNSIPEPVWENFLYNWLDENRPSVALCYRAAIDWTANFYPELLDSIPCEMTFRRRIEKDISVSVKTLLRDGEKAFSDRCAPYIMRMYDKLSANSCWIADNHTFDIQSYDEENKIHRLYLTAFLDAKSGVLTGWNITESPDSQSTVLALRHGIMRFGIPECIYVDNGREFLTHDIGGRGHRSGGKITAENNPPTIFETLGIEMRNAIVRNAKAKPIERTFYTVKNQFSKLFKGFCGGTVLERPESLKRRIKNGNVPCDYEIREVFENWIDGEYNLQEYGGSEQIYKGFSRIEVWNRTASEIRKAPEAALNLMLMRTTRKQKIKRNGVYVTICGEKIWFTEPEKTIMNLEREVYVRYNPADLRNVRIYDASTDKYLFTWEIADNLMADYLEENIETLSNANAIIRETKKFVREQAKETTSALSNKQRLTLLDMTVRKAQYRKDNDFSIQHPKKIIPVIINEEHEELMAAGSESITIDLDKMTKNAETRKKSDVYR